MPENGKADVSYPQIPKYVPKRRFRKTNERNACPSNYTHVGLSQQDFKNLDQLKKDFKSAKTKKAKIMIKDKMNKIMEAKQHPKSAVKPASSSSSISLVGEPNIVGAKQHPKGAEPASSSSSISLVGEPNINETILYIHDIPLMSQSPLSCTNTVGSQEHDVATTQSLAQSLSLNSSVQSNIGDQYYLEDSMYKSILDVSKSSAKSSTDIWNQSTQNFIQDDPSSSTTPTQLLAAPLFTQADPSASNTSIRTEAFMADLQKQVGAKRAFKANLDNRNVSTQILGTSQKQSVPSFDCNSDSDFA